MGIEKLKGLGTVRRFGAKDFICYEGEMGSEMYLILSGEVGVYTDSFGGNPNRVALLSTGDFLGEMSLLEEVPRSASGIAETDVVVLVIAKDNFRRFLQEMPELGYSMMQKLSSRIRMLEDALLGFTGGNREILLAANFGSEGKTKPVDEANEQAKQNNGILPEGHKTYNLNAPASYENFYFSKNITCPVCQGEFETKIPRMTKLRLDRVENDLREIFVDFDPLWYTIRTCPHCFFAQVYTEFDKTSRLSAKALLPYQEKALDLRGEISLPAGEPLSINRVLMDYYLAIYFATGDDESPLVLGKLYMSLAWLYQDLGDDDFYRQSWNKAFEYYYQAYYGDSNVRLKPEHEQQLCLILGELYLRKGEIREALKHFHKAIRRLDGANYYNNRARDRYMEVKEETESNKE